MSPAPAGAPRGDRPPPPTRTLANLVVFVRFAGEDPFAEPFATYQAMFGAPEPDHPLTSGSVDL
jgi:hypothetical protein